MNTETPETSDAWNAVSCMPNGMYDSTVPMERYAAAMLDHSKKLERERDEWRAKYIQQNKDLGCEMMDPNGTIWDHAQTLQRERDDARAEMIRWMSIAEGRGHSDSLASGQQLHRAEMEYETAVNAYHEAEQECRSSFYEHNQASYLKGRRDALRMFLPVQTISNQ